MPVRWYGDQIKRKIKEAQKTGINRTMSECVIHAKQNHTWRNRTGVLEGSINIVQFARETATGALGTWGSQDVIYALIHELGGVITPKTAQRLLIRDTSGNIVASASQVIIPARPYLRPAAFAIYPKLAEYIRQAFGSG